MCVQVYRLRAYSLRFYIHIYLKHEGDGIPYSSLFDVVTEYTSQITYDFQYHSYTSVYGTTYTV